MTTLTIKDLHVAVGGKEIVKGISLDVSTGQLVALMGPNGSGKSTLAHALLGHPAYAVTAGRILLDGEDLTGEKPDARARKGLFLSFQYPQEVEGVTIANFLRLALNARSERPVNVMEFRKVLQEKMALLEMNPDFAMRYLNVGFSGGEKKRAEILQMAVLEPAIAVLDETDSGLDIDALRVVAQGIQKVRARMGILLITHYCRILEYLTPDVVHVILDGRIAKTGGEELARELEQKGYGDFAPEIGKK